MSIASENIAPGYIAPGDITPGPIAAGRFRRRARAQAPALRALSRVCECHACGLLQRLPVLEPGHVARCTRCATMLGRRRTNPPIATPLAFSISSLVLYLIGISQPLMTLDILGRVRAVNLFTGPVELVREGWVAAGLLVGAVTTLLPAVEIGLILAILLGALHHRLPWRVTRMMSWYERLRPWSMVEVYLLGVLVAYTKMIDLADVSVDPAAYALFGLMLTMAATDFTLDHDAIWSRKRVRLVQRCPIDHSQRYDALAAHKLPALDHVVSCRTCALVCYSERPLAAEQDAGLCPRCGDRLQRRKTDSLRRTMLLVFSAVVLYIPANVYPVMNIVRLHRGGGHTILAGVRELYEAGMLPLALLVFFASITVPVLKILSLCLMCLASWRGSSERLVDRTRLFRIVDFVGRWSMIDVFMISILVAMVNFGQLANVRADAGMFAFAAVVVLTIFAANSFDPRSMWDRAGLNGRALAGARSPPLRRDPESIRA